MQLQNIDPMKNHNTMSFHSVHAKLTFMLSKILIFFILLLYIINYTTALDCLGKDKYSQECNLHNAPGDGHGHAHDHGHGHAHDHGHGHAHDHGHSHSGRAASSAEREAFESMQRPVFVKLHGWQLWFESLSCTLLISIFPFILLMFVRVDNSAKHQSLLKVLLSFAAGGLLGDAFLHLIPHAIDPHDHSGGDHAHSHSHSHGHGHDHSKHMQVGLWVLAGVLVFLLVEKMVRFANPQHSHSHSAPETKKDKGDKKKNDKSPPKKKKEDEKSEEISEQSNIKIAGYLNLAADFLHNFTDGLAIGASYLEGKNLGIITTVTVLFHEIPHEIGDYAILVQSGVPVWRARFLQLLTAVGALLGTVVALVCQGVNPAYTAWILPFTAGGFIYIALVSVIPELLEESSLKQTVKELVFFLLGVAMMVVIGIYE